MKSMAKRIIPDIAALIITITVILAASGIVKAARNGHYYRYTDPVGRIETKFTAMGEFEVAGKEYDADDVQIKKYTVWYPKTLEDETRLWPVVLWANEGGCTAGKYTAFLKHLASWGFVVVGNDDKNTRTGNSLNAGIDLLISEDQNPDSIFCGRIDLDHIGIGGKTQGGCAVYNMATVQSHADMIKAVYAASVLSPSITENLGDGWAYDLSSLQAPIFITAGTAPFGAGDVAAENTAPEGTGSSVEADDKPDLIPLWSREVDFDALPDDVDLVFGRRTGCDYSNSYLKWDGYMTAWFSYYLKGDEDAGKAFFGPSPELEENRRYQDIRIRQAAGEGCL